MRVMDRGPEAAQAVLQRVLELGANLIDTADIYGHGTIEETIAAALHPYPDGVVIATKGGQTHRDGKPHPNCNPEYLRSACEASLKRLRVDRIDLYQLHQPDPEVPVEESIGALAQLRAEGKIRLIGVSNFSVLQLEAASATTSIASVQNIYNVTKRDYESVLEECGQRQIAFMPYFPLAAGELATANGELARVAGELGATSAQVAIAWLLRHSPVMLPIPGTSSVAHLEENEVAASLRLTDEQVTRLDACYAPAA
jgi:aryl-alcohol dehydrogenase-like predicted oxidoreductase